jgi:hypothetical protein
MLLQLNSITNVSRIFTQISCIGFCGMVIKESYIIIRPKITHLPTRVLLAPGRPDRRPCLSAAVCFPRVASGRHGPQLALGPLCERRAVVGPPLHGAFACSSGRVSHRARATAARWRKRKGGEGEERARCAARGRSQTHRRHCNMCNTRSTFETSR